MSTKFLFVQFLVTLDLRSNQIDQNGIQHLVQPLSSNKVSSHLSYR